MRAAVLEAPRKFAVVGKDTPRPGPGEVRVRTVATAVCHTDLSIYAGKHPGVRYPVVLGHESTGVIDKVGDGVEGLVPGQHVIVNPAISCGRCDCCARGATHLCRNAGMFGRDIEGSLKQYVCLPERFLHALPAALPLNEATLIETLATVRHAQKRLGLGAGESVVVLGEGTSGLLHTRLAVLSGANPVIAVSRSRWKLDRASAMGAHHVIDTGAEGAVSEVLRLTGGNGADTVIDTAGGAAALRAGIEMLRPGGRFSAFSISHESAADLNLFPFYYKEISIIGSRALLPEDMAPSIDLVASGAIDVKGFITATYPLGHAAEAFQEYEKNPGRILRIVIDSEA
ncbi:MAG TPA: alcohol dehydrogenase catalytic domain-containing protein [Burkholderiales bacterium]|nr:alcohol dehydrogenase catalytic domain-containing protein [Burkholderiales bacterium]